MSDAQFRMQTHGCWYSYVNARLYKHMLAPGIRIHSKGVPHHHSRRAASGHGTMNSGRRRWCAYLLSQASCSQLKRQMAGFAHSRSAAAHRPSIVVAEELEAEVADK